MADHCQRQQKVVANARILESGSLYSRLAAGKMADRADIERAVANGADRLELNRRCGLFSADKVRLREARISGYGPALNRRKKQKAAAVSA